MTLFPGMGFSVALLIRSSSSSAFFIASSVGFVSSGIGRV